MMERRSFLKGFAALIGGVALEEAIPLGRVWSFPSKIVVASAYPVVPSLSLTDLATVYYDKKALEILKRHLVFRNFCLPENSLTS